MKVTRIYRGLVFSIEKAVKTVLFGVFVVIVAFIFNNFVDDVEIVQRF